MSWVIFFYPWCQEGRQLKFFFIMLIRIGILILTSKEEPEKLVTILGFFLMTPWGCIRSRREYLEAIWCQLMHTEWENDSAVTIDKIHQPLEDPPNVIELLTVSYLAEFWDIAMPQNNKLIPRGNMVLMEHPKTFPIIEFKERNHCKSFSLMQFTWKQFSTRSHPYFLNSIYLTLKLINFFDAWCSRNRSRTSKYRIFFWLSRILNTVGC